MASVATLNNYLHRSRRTEHVSDVVRGAMNKKSATALVQRRAGEKVSADDRARLTEIVETELMSLHEGNIAGYRLRPSEYEV